MLSEEALLSPPATDEASPTGMIQEEAAPAPKAESSPPSQAESNPPSQAQSNPPSQDESGGTGTEAKPAKTIVRSTQRAEYADYLSATGDALAAIFAANEPLRTYLAEQGLTAEFLAARQSIFDVALASIETRQAAMAAFAAAVEDQERAESLARTSYVAFRKIAHRTLTSYTARLALRLQQRVPGGLKEFVDSARQVLATAKTEPFATQLALVAMGPDQIDGALAELDAVELLHNRRLAAATAAKEATAARDEAIRNLRDAMHPIKVAVETVLRRNPGLVRPVGL